MKTQMGYYVNFIPKGWIYQKLIMPDLKNVINMLNDRPEKMYKFET